MISDALLARPLRTSLYHALAIILCTVLSQSALAQTVFINEIHYDNAGADTGEAIEVAGPAGTSLTGWTIALYNGSASQRNVYDTIPLSGTIPDQNNGFGTVSFLRSGIQNGSPDGLALVDSANVLIQFLSYEGTFTALSGPATNQTSTDIGVAEVSSSAIGESLQLTGTGTTYTDFAWAPSGPASFGSVNPGQTFNGGGGPTSPIVINEVDADTPGSDAAEFVELFDGGTGNTALDGLVLVFFNGNGDSAYSAIDLDSYTTDADGYFLAGNIDVMPTPAVVFQNNGLQNGADAVALYFGGEADFPPGTAVTTDNLIDALVYDTSDGDDAGLLVLLNGSQPQVNERGGGNSAGHSNQRCPNGSGGARNTGSYAQFAPTPGAENVCVAPPMEVRIHEVQGNGAASPLDGETVAIEGIVVGDFQDGAAGANGDLNGFFVQEEDLDADGDASTSEGIFVFNGSSPSVDVAIGDLVRVVGGVSEFNGLTEITSFTGVTVLSNDNPLPTVSALSLPVTSIDDFEAFEGMYVTFPQSLVISDYNNFDRFGQIVLTSQRRLTPTAEFDPGPDALAATAAFALDNIQLDDGRTSQNPDPAIHPNGLDFDLDNLFRGGDSLSDVTGVLDYSFGQYRIHPTQGAVHFSDNPRPVEPDAVGGSIQVGSMNVLNYFSTLDYPSSDPRDNTCGPAQNQGCRGADNAEELERQRAKIVAAITGLGAEVIGLIEIENNIDDDAVIDLVAGLNDANGAGTYDYVATGPIGDDVIKVAILFQPDAVTPVGDYAILDSSVDARFNDDKNRPVLAQTFIDNSTGGIFTVAVNHFKSKGANCNDVGDPDTGDGSGNCNVTRTLAAQALVDWLATDPTGSGDEDFIILGDLNAYDKEDPIDEFVAAGYTDLLQAFRGEDAYTFVFGAQIGYLDYALSSSNLTDQVTGTTEWHINADEPDLLDYDTSFKRPAQDAIYAPDAYRSSDHDPVLVGLDTCDAIAPTIDSINLSPNVLWPANHKYVDVNATVLASDNFDPNVSVTLLSAVSNEPDNGPGDGNTVDDIVIVNDFELKLRAERAGGGSGRVYTLTYQATDDCGNSTTAEAYVTVPKSQGKSKGKSKSKK